MANKRIYSLTQEDNIENSHCVILDMSGQEEATYATITNLSNKVLLNINSQTAETTFESSDVGIVIDDPSGSPVVRKGTLQNIVKGGAVDGAVSGLIDSNLTINRAIEVNASGKIVASNITAAELALLDGITGDTIQTQLTSAVHKATAGEIHAIEEKASPIAADEVLIEDSENIYNKKRAQISNLPVTDSTAIHDNVASEISVIAEKTSLVSGDKIIIEDSEDDNNKKMVQIGNLFINFVSVPEHDNSSGTIGQIAYESGFLYVCVGTNTWQRTVLAGGF